MGIGVVLIVYLIGLSILAAGCSVVLAIAARWYLRNVSSNRAKITRYAALLPFACVLYAGIWFVAYAVINDQVFHHDPMIGDDWYTDIGNGYAIDMIDVTDYGTVHPVGVLNSPSDISGLMRMQVAGTQIFGSEDQTILKNFGLINKRRIFSSPSTLGLTQRRNLPVRRSLRHL